MAEHASAVAAGYRFVEHVGEVELEFEAASASAVFEAAVAALAELLETDGDGDPVLHEIELEAGDRALLLVDWLSELVFLAEVEEFVPERVAALELTDGHLRATVAGHRGRPCQLVKAVTLNNLEFEQVEGAWRGRVVLDV